MSVNPGPSKFKRASVNENTKFAKACAVSFKERADKNAKAAVAEYFLAARAAFHGTSDISLAVDATRVGGRGCFLGIAVRPDNTCRWLPPQASTESSSKVKGVLPGWRVCELFCTFEFDTQILTTFSC